MYRLRFILVMLKSFLSKKKGISEDLVLKFWVIPFVDTDLTRLFTQTYNQYMGLARWNLVFNSEFRTGALKRGWVPVTAKETISYKRSIKAFDRIVLTTRLIHWNERRFYHEHIFTVKGEVRAVCYIEGLVRGPKGHLKPTEVFKALGVSREAPPMPDNMKGWAELIYEPHKNVSA